MVDARALKLLKSSWSRVYSAQIDNSVPPSGQRLPLRRNEVGWTLFWAHSLNVLLIWMSQFDSDTPENDSRCLPARKACFLQLQLFLRCAILGLFFFIFVFSILLYNWYIKYSRCWDLNSPVLFSFYQRRILETWNVPWGWAHVKYFSRAFFPKAKASKILSQKCQKSVNCQKSIYSGHGYNMMTSMKMGYSED